jgi:hypothetical protein
MTPADYRERLKKEYWTLSERRFVYLESVKREQAVRNGRSTKPPRLIVAEDMLVRLDVKLTEISQMIGAAPPEDPTT